MTSQPFADAQAVMRRAIELARRAEGRVEPNPQVGAVIVDDNLRPIAEGYHEFFGGPHAEINALASAGPLASGATMFVTLEPCCHLGKTGPCTDAIVRAEVRRVVVGLEDPNPRVSGGGIAALRSAGIEVEVGLLADESRRLVAPFLKLLRTGRPYMHAKWAMTLDGKIATRTGAARWISNETSRERVHQLRGRMDAVMIGARTALADDPLLTTRRPGPRTAVRVVVDSRAALSNESRLVQSLKEAPLIVATCDADNEANVRRLSQAGVEILLLPKLETFADRDPGGRPHVDTAALLDELGRRGMTNVLVEGGSQLLGHMFDRGLVDEVHVFIATKIVGGTDAVTAVGGDGLEEMPQLSQIENAEIEVLDGDVYIHGPLRRDS